MIELLKIVGALLLISTLFCLFFAGLIMPPLIYNYYGMPVTLLGFFGWMFWIVFYVGAFIYLIETRTR